MLSNSAHVETQIVTGAIKGFLIIRLLISHCTQNQQAFDDYLRWSHTLGGSLPAPANIRHYAESTTAKRTATTIASSVDAVGRRPLELFSALAEQVAEHEQG
jgi:hypothetical protein